MLIYLNPYPSNSNCAFFFPIQGDEVILGGNHIVVSCFEFLDMPDQFSMICGIMLCLWGIATISPVTYFHLYICLYCFILKLL